jgi:hypothetical protein
MDGYDGRRCYVGNARVRFGYRQRHGNGKRIGKPDSSLPRRYDNDYRRFAEPSGCHNASGNNAHADGESGGYSRRGSGSQLHDWRNEQHGMDGYEGRCRYVGNAHARFGYRQRHGNGECGGKPDSSHPHRYGNDYRRFAEPSGCRSNASGSNARADGESGGYFRRGIGRHVCHCGNEQRGLDGYEGRCRYVDNAHVRFGYRKRHGKGKRIIEKTDTNHPRRYDNDYHRFGEPSGCRNAGSANYALPEVLFEWYNVGGLLRNDPCVSVL